MKLFIIPNREKENTGRCLGELERLLAASGVEYEVALARGGIENLRERGFDAIIALGGDGTIIRTAKLSGLSCRLPVLGINTGRFGFTAGLEADELSMAEELLGGRYSIEKRMLLSVSVTAGDGTVKSRQTAINDAVISRGVMPHIIDLRVLHGGNEAMSFRADGLIICTPTGSTAYSLSAGGPIIDPCIRCVALTPVCPHSLNIRPIVFSPTPSIRIVPEKRECDYGAENETAYLSVDGEPTVALYPGDSVFVKESQMTADFIVIKQQSFASNIWRKFT